MEVSDPKLNIIYSINLPKLNEIALFKFIGIDLYWKSWNSSTALINSISQYYPVYGR
jgi:hypothetical protein